MLPKFISDLLWPEIVPLPTALVETYRVEVDAILTACNVPGFKVSDNTKISSLFYTSSHSAMTIGMSPRTYTESQLNDNKMDALKAFAEVVKLFDGVSLVSLEDKVVNLAKYLHEYKLTIEMEKESVE
jgi:hypothetical protein